MIRRLFLWMDRAPWGWLVVGFVVLLLVSILTGRRLRRMQPPEGES